jgi:hypothetical protein
MNLRVVLTAGAGACALLMSALPAAACATFSVQQNELTHDYNPFKPNGGVQGGTFMLRAERTDSGAQGVRVLLVDATPTSSGPGLGNSGPRDYSILWTEDAGQRVLVWGAETLNMNLGATVNFNSVGTGASSFQLSVPAGQPISGDQTERLEVQYQCFGAQGPIGDVQVQRNSDITLRLRAQDYFGAFVTSEGGRRGQIDFGILDPNGGDVTKSLGVTMVSTSPYTVQVDSEGGGEMKRNGAGLGIPYSMTFAGAPISDGSVIHCPQTPAPAGTSHNLGVTLNGSRLRDLRAGEYRDTITLTFSPREGGTGACRVQGG